MCFVFIYNYKIDKLKEGLISFFFINLKGAFMKPVLIIIRGNLASGKTTLAMQLQESLGIQQTFLVQPSTDDDTLAIEKLVQYGHNHFAYTIIEGLLPVDVYKNVVKSAVDMFGDQVLLYYLNVSLEQSIQYSHDSAIEYDASYLKHHFVPYEQIHDDEKMLTGSAVDVKKQQVIDDINHLPLF